MRAKNYTSIHNWLYYWYGKANKCENKKCSNNTKQYEWANISGDYLRVRKDYKMLCISCHRRFDYKKRHGNECLKGHEFTKENTYIWKGSGRRKCIKCTNEKQKERYWKYER